MRDVPCPLLAHRKRMQGVPGVGRKHVFRDPCGSMKEGARVYLSTMQTPVSTKNRLATLMGRLGSPRLSLRMATVSWLHHFGLQLEAHAVECACAHTELPAHRKLDVQEERTRSALLLTFFYKRAPRPVNFW